MHILYLFLYVVFALQMIVICILQKYTFSRVTYSDINFGL